MDEMKNSQIGILNNSVIKLLGLGISEEKPIYLSETNILHMKARHPDVYNKYGSFIKDILSSPDYVGIDPNNDSIDYVREFKIDNEFVKVAVRVSSKGVFFARSMYTLKNSRVEKYINKGTLKPLDKFH